MTTGTFTQDLRTYVTYACGPCRPGLYYTKTWSGGDYAQEPSREVNVWVDNPRAFPRGDKRDRRGNGSEPEIDLATEQRGWFKTIWVRGPKRAEKEYHSYNTSWTRFHDPEMRYIHPSQPSILRTGTVNGCIGIPWFSGNPWSSSDDYALLALLRNKVVGSEFNAAVFLGEGKEALAMITDSAIRIAKAMVSVRHGNYHRAVSALTSGRTNNRATKHRWTPDPEHRAVGHASFIPQSGSQGIVKLVDETQVANMWLQLQYGWLPLLSDAYDGARFLAHHLNVPLEHRVVVRRNCDGRHSSDVNTAVYPFPAGYTYHPERHLLLSRKQIIAILREKDVAQLSGLTNPASLAWELLPYSFVADWFLPIGAWLDARGLANGLTGTFVTTSLYKERYSRYEFAHPVPIGYKIDSPSFYYEKGTVVRTVSDTLAVPLPSIKPLGAALSWKHCVNAVALLSQVFGGKS